MKIQNTTNQNRSKQARLASERTIPRHHVDSLQVTKFLLTLDEFATPKAQLLYSIGLVLLEKNTNPAVQAFLAEYDFELANVQGVPRGAFDLLGSAYQYLNTKSENLDKGSFYTGKNIGNDFVEDLDFSEGQVLIDPSCGSGSFLFRSDAAADQVFGIDVDPIAIMVAKFNYFIKFPNAAPPALYCADFFTWFIENQHLTFDYVIGNPPFGAEVDLSVLRSAHIVSGESFSYFIEFGYALLKPDGILRYLVPDALLNVKRHTDVRSFLLNHANLKIIKRYQSKFSGVMSDVYMIEVDRCQDNAHTTFVGESKVTVPKALFRSLKNSILVQWSEADIAVVEKINEQKKFDLARSTFGLGVVTGDNKTKLLSLPGCNLEPIYTGKEVERYTLLPPRNYIRFDRRSLQQVAPDELYRAAEKLVYKTISKNLRFAFDDTGSLTTNSANLVIPRLPGYDVMAVMALLNSNLYSFLYLKLFGGVNKIGKEHLMALPFPEISFEQNAELIQFVKAIAISGDDEGLQAYIHEHLFRLTPEEIAHINRTIK